MLITVSSRHRDKAMTVRLPDEARTAGQAVLDDRDLQLKAFVVACFLALAAEPDALLPLLAKYWPEPRPLGRPPKKGPPAGGE